LLNHKQEVITFLNINKIDILLISESHFTSLTVFKIPQYNVYNTPHPDGTAHGGTTLTIRKSISHYALPQYQTNKLQATFVEVNTLPWRLTVAAVYSPPRHSISTDEYKDFLQTLGHRFIVGGDWNAKHTQWGSRLSTTKGRNLWRAMSDCNCDYISTGEPTYWLTDQRKLPDLLDFFVSHGLSRHNYLIHSSFDLSSDHTPVIVSLSTAAIATPLPPRLTTRHTDWNIFQNYLEDKTNLNIRLKSPADLDEAVHYFTTLVQKAAWFSTPAKEHQATFTPNTPLHIRQLIAAK
jgi:exonuclease III